MLFVHYALFKIYSRIGHVISRASLLELRTVSRHHLLTHPFLPLITGYPHAASGYKVFVRSILVGCVMELQ